MLRILSRYSVAFAMAAKYLYIISFPNTIPVVHLFFYVVFTCICVNSNNKSIVTKCFILLIILILNQIRFDERKRMMCVYLIFFYFIAGQWRVRGTSNNGRNNWLAANYSWIDSSDGATKFQLIYFWAKPDKIYIYVLVKWVMQHILA